MRGNELGQAAKCLVVLVKVGKKRSEALAGSVSGTVLPVSYHPDLELVADPSLLGHDEIFFNAARLDRSMALATEDYLRVAKPRVEPIVA